MAEKIVIASGKGGVGKTTICIGLGKALSSMGKKVLLVDCDCLRSLDVMLGITQHLVYDWGDEILGRCEKGSNVYDDSSICLMSCPVSYEGIYPEDMKELISEHDGNFDFILFDAPAGIGTGLRLAAAAADKALIVSTPDSLCVRSACRAGREIEKMGIADIRLIVNRVKKFDILRGRLLDIDSVIDSSELQLLGLVPEKPKIKYGSMGNIESIVETKELHNIAGRLAGENIPLKF